MSEDRLADSLIKSVETFDKGKGYGPMKCYHCSGSIAPGTDVRARYCSPRCRTAAHSLSVKLKRASRAQANREAHREAYQARRREALIARYGVEYADSLMRGYETR